MDKLGKLSAIFFGDAEPTALELPLSPFLLQSWRRSGRRRPESADLQQRAQFFVWYVERFYCRNAPYQPPLPSIIEAFLNEAEINFGWEGDATSGEARFISRFMHHVWQKHALRFDLTVKDGYFSFLSWFAFEFIPQHNIPPVLLPRPLLEALNRPAADLSLPLTAGMLAYSKLSRRNQFRDLSKLSEAQVYAVCYEMVNYVLSLGNAQLIPGFVSSFWRAPAGDGKTVFEQVTQFADALSETRVNGLESAREPVSMVPTAHLLSSRAQSGASIPELPPVRPNKLSIISYRDQKTLCGLSKAGAHSVSALQKMGLETLDLDYDLLRNRSENEIRHNARFFSNSERYVHVFNLNPEHVLECILCNLSRIKGQDYFVGQFYWELSDVCAVHEPSLAAMDEIWVASDFLVNVYSRRMDIPVINMGTVVSPSVSETPYTRADLGLPEKDYLFLVNFDAGSIVERKNPLAAVLAFKDAFPRGGEKAGLIVKTRNIERCSARDRDHWTQTLKWVERDCRIQVINETWPEDALRALYHLTDAYVSLHRSEGFGYGPAEAMFFGKPVVTTAYSGVCDFCTDATAKLVDYQLIQVKQGEYPFLNEERSYFWADPNIETASLHMRQLCEYPELGLKLGEEGQRLIRRKYSRQGLADRYAERLRRLGFLAAASGEPVIMALH